MHAPAPQFGIGADVCDPSRKDCPPEQIEIIISPANYLLDMGNERTWVKEIWR